MKITLKELLDFEFTTNEDGKIIALVPLSKVNEIADILTNQKERIDKAIEIIKREFLCYDNESDEYKWGKILLEILGDKE